MEFKGTKGVWELDCKTERIIIGNSLNKSICDVWMFGEQEDTKEIEMIANAKLIAAAPELLFQVNELIELLAFHGYTNSTEIYQAKQLIKKVTE